MTAKTIFTALLIAGSSPVALAYKKTEGSEKLEKVTLVQNVELDEIENLKLKSVAHGLRNKKVAFMNFKVYVAEVLISENATWDRKPQDLLSAPHAAVQMTFLRDVPAENMMEAFSDSLKKNDIDVKADTNKAFLETVKKIGSLKEKDILLVGRIKKATDEQVFILIPGKFKETLKGPPGWSDGILKIWAGKAADAGMEKLQQELFHP